MWCLCPSGGARCCLARHGASWEKYFTPWRGASTNGTTAFEAAPLTKPPAPRGVSDFRLTDAVQEFAVQTSVATAEFGRGTGGQVSIVTKSGSNQFHGSAFEYLRNSVLDAADFFTNTAAKPKNPLHRNQYGATLRAPIRTGKTYRLASS